jgi:hypothetical protein
MLIKKKVSKIKNIKNKKPLENIIHETMNAEMYTVNYAIYPKRKYIEISFLKNNTHHGYENITEFDLKEFSECITKIRKIAKSQKLKYIIMDTWIFNAHPKLMDYACKKYHLEHYNSKLIKTNPRLNWELYKSKMREFWLNEGYPTHIFKIKD